MALAQTCVSRPRISRTLNIRFESHHCIQAAVPENFTVYQVKQHLTEHHDLPATECRLIYHGQELTDDTSIQDCNIGARGLLHLVRDPQRRQSDTVGLNQLSALTGGLIGNSSSTSADDNENSSSLPAIFVYCKSTCKDIAPGRILVRCAVCKRSNFQLNNELKNWESSLHLQDTDGFCRENDCNGDLAEFYFQCRKHKSDIDETAVLLDLIHENTREVPCITCAGVGASVLVFPCPSRHTMCLECFQIYCTIKLNDRDFTEHEVVGYTLPCPAGCENSLIQDAHHFRILGSEQYDRYQRFGAEEYILKMGGVLCPRPGCGAGLLPDPGVSRVICMQGCGFVFCRHCKEGIHDGDCDTPETLGSLTPSFHIDEANAERARWDEDSKRTINATTKRCPGCKVPTEKIDGCMHMTCSRCNFEWCWVCVIEWNYDCQGQHWFG